MPSYSFMGRMFIEKGKKGREREERKKERDREGQRLASSEKWHNESRSRHSLFLNGAFTPAHRIRVLPAKHAVVATLPVPSPQEVGPGLC